jgi:elongation factor Ts
MSDLSLIKKLRETTGCGIVHCKEALGANDNDFEKSIDWLRKKGLSSASKKSGRITSEGLVSVLTTENKASIVEVNSETDFVARNQKFQEFVADITKSAINFENVEELKASKHNNGNISIDEELKNQIGVIGENINIRRLATLKVNQGTIVSYIHNAVVPNKMGKIGVLVAFESNAKKDKIETLGKQIAMHIAAAKPDTLSIESVDPSKLQREIEILKEQARSSGKPESIIEKMMEGRIKKYYEEVVLLEQNFVMDDKLKIKDLLNNFAKQENANVNISAFKLFILGEGIEKKELDFANEVASITGNINS